jgi:hypothetical protein
LKSLTDNLNLGPEKTGSYKFCLREPPHKRQSVYQLVDIHDVAIQRILAEAAYPSVYDKKYGWFCQETLNLVRQKMKNIFEYSFRKDEGYSTITGETSQQAENDVLKSLFSESCHEGKDLNVFGQPLSSLLTSIPSDEEVFNLFKEDQDSNGERVFEQNI